MKNNTIEKNQHGLAVRFIDFVKSHYTFDGIKNETWMYLNEHQESIGDLEAKDNMIPFKDFDNYLH